MRIIFADIDGVFHDADSPQLDMEGNEIRVVGSELFVWAPILEQLLEPHPDVQIVIHSSWRHHFSLKEIRRRFPLALSRRIASCTPPGDRAESIERYVEQHGITDFLIIDDYLPEFCRGENLWIHYDHLMIVQGATGISPPVVQAQIRDWLERRRWVESLNPASVA